MRGPGIVAAAAILVAVILGLGGCAGTSLEFTLTDAVSGSWVWNATAHLQGRSMQLFFQSDRGPVPQRFTGLEPGSSELLIEAPGYRSVALPVRLNRGPNRMPEPVRMVGLDIPGLDHWIIVEQPEGRDLVAELRPIGSDGAAVLNHPCLELWIGARVSEQLKNGTPVQERTERDCTRGDELFRGPVAWRWDRALQKTFRYSLRIPGGQIRMSTAPYRVIDYVVVVPDPDRITKPELDRLMAALPWGNPAQMMHELSSDQGRFRWQIVTSWNVKAGVP